MTNANCSVQCSVTIWPNLKGVLQGSLWARNDLQLLVNSTLWRG